MYNQKIEKRIALLRTKFYLESNVPIRVSRLEKCNSNKRKKIRSIVINDSRMVKESHCLGQFQWEGL